MQIKKILFFASTIILFNAGTQIFCMDAPEERKLLKEFNTVISPKVSNFGRAGEIINLFQKAKKETIANQLKNRLQAAQQRTPARPGRPTVPTKFTMKDCTKAITDITDFFGRYPINNKISTDPNTSVRDLIFDTYTLLRDIGIANLKTKEIGGIGGYLDPYEEKNVLARIKQRFDVVQQAIQMGRDPNIQNLLAALDDMNDRPASDIQDALNNFLEFGSTFDNARSISDIYTHMANTLAALNVTVPKNATFDVIIEAVQSELPNEFANFLTYTPLSAAAPSTKQEAIQTINSFQRDLSGLMPTQGARIASSLTQLDLALRNAKNTENNLTLMKSHMQRLNYPAPTNNAGADTKRVLNWINSQVNAPSLVRSFLNNIYNYAPKFN